jgi:hypothetical protein
MPKKIICWVLKTHQKKMKELYPHWEMEFVDSAEELVKMHKEFDTVIVALTKVRMLKTVNILKQIEQIFYIEVKGLITNSMVEAQKNTKFFYAMDVTSIERYIDNPF